MAPSCLLNVSNLYKLNGMLTVSLGIHKKNYCFVNTNAFESFESRLTVSVVISRGCEVLLWICTNFLEHSLMNHKPSREQAVNRWLSK